MNRYSESEIRELLTPKDTPRPPAGLAERIKEEIPEQLEVAPGVVTLGRPTRLHGYLLAASVLATVGGAVVLYRVWQSFPAPEAPAEVRAEAASDDRAEKKAVAEAAAPVTRSGPAREESLRSPALADEAGVRPAAKRADLAEDATPPSPPPPPPPPPPPAPRSMGVLAPPPAAEPGAPDSRSALRRSSIATGAEAGQVSGAGSQSSRRRTQNQRLEMENEELRRQLSEFGATLRPPAPRAEKLSPPNDAPYDSVYFRDYGTHPFIDTEDDALSTFGLDVDTASYTVVRRHLRDGHLPDPAAVRVEELINYFDYGDAPPERGDFAIYAEGAPSPFGEGERYYLLRFHLRGRDLAAEERRPANLTFVVDVSGSMERENRLGLVRQALGLLLGQLRDDDRVALVVYGSRARVVLEPTSDRERIRAALAELRPQGSTNAEEGLRLGYELAARARRSGATNRVILCSDGVANVGSTSAGTILEQVAGFARLGIELTTVGFGMGNYNDVLMEQLADHGNGRYAYVDTLEEARRIFVEDLTGTLQTIAAEARAQVEFNPRVVARYRLVGYENREVADERFRDDDVDAGEIGAGHAVTALYEVKLREGWNRRSELATLRLRYGSVISGEMVETARTLTGADVAATWDEASAALRLTTLVAEFGEILKRSYWARTGNLDDLFRRAQAVATEFPGDADVAELVSLIGKAARYQPQAP